MCEKDRLDYVMNVCVFYDVLCKAGLVESCLGYTDVEFGEQYA